MEQREEAQVEIAHRRVSEEEDAQHVVMYCRHGMKSLCSVFIYLLGHAWSSTGMIRQQLANGQLVAYELTQRSITRTNATPAKLRDTPRALAAVAIRKMLPAKHETTTKHAEYMPYSAHHWNATALGAAAGVLATQSLLVAATGMGSAHAGLAAASFNWVLKDGIGQLAAVFSAAALAGRFDDDPKRWRSAAAAAEVGARVCEAAAPLLPAAAFLPLASAANLFKSIACLATSATRARFHAHLALADNLADVTAKAGSQSIVAALVGTGGGLALAATSPAPEHSLALVGALGLGQLAANEASLRALALPLITRAAAPTLAAAHMCGEPIPTPAEYARARRPTARGGAELAPLRLRLGTPLLDELCRDAAELERLRRGARESKHLAALDGMELRMLMLSGAGGADVMVAHVHALRVAHAVRGATTEQLADADYRRGVLERELDEALARREGVVCALKSAGWSVSSALQHAQDAASSVELRCPSYLGAR